MVVSAAHPCQTDIRHAQPPRTPTALATCPQHTASQQVPAAGTGKKTKNSGTGQTPAKKQRSGGPPQGGMAQDGTGEGVCAEERPQQDTPGHAMVRACVFTTRGNLPPFRTSRQR